MLMEIPLKSRDFLTKDSSNQQTQRNSTNDPSFEALFMGPQPGKVHQKLSYGLYKDNASVCQYKFQRF